MFIEQLIEFFYKFFINGEYDDTEKDYTIRLYTSFLLLYIEQNEFNEVLLNAWSNEIKPYLIRKYPITKGDDLFNKNSDLDYLINSLENEIKKCKKEMKKKSKIRLLFKEFDRNQKNTIKIKRINSMINLTTNSQNNNNETILDDTNILEDGNLNINQLIDNNNNYEKKGNDNTDVGFLKILKKSNTINEKGIGQIDIDTRNKRSKTFRNIKEMLPRYKDLKEENDFILYKVPNNNLSFISADLMLKKIFFDDFMNKNDLLIYHFCQ